MTMQTPWVGSTRTLLGLRSEWASPALCSRATARAILMHSRKKLRKSPSSAGANFSSRARFRGPMNRMPFFSLPLMKSGPVWKKKCLG